MNWRRMRKHRIAWINARLTNVKARETMCAMIRALIYVRDDALFLEERFEVLSIMIFLVAARATFSEIPYDHVAL